MPTAKRPCGETVSSPYQGRISAQFTYNGDGQKVKSVINGETVYLVNGYYEKKGSETTKYYMAGAARVAIRKYTIP
jgi:hypothetical protein